MIQFSLKCADGHEFDSWFQSGDAYDKLALAGMVSCAVCGGGQVEKAIMAPRVQVARTQNAQPSGALSTPASAHERALAELRRRVEENSDYVGLNFAAEARAMHDGTAPERAIYGEARLDEARALLEDGVPVAPLPLLPQRKAN